MNQFYAGIAEIFEVDEAEIGPDFDLVSHNWDLLNVVSVIALVDECFNKLLDGTSLAKCKTVSDVEALLSLAEAA